MRTRIIVGIALIVLLIGLVIGTAGTRRTIGGHLRHGVRQVELVLASSPSSRGRSAQGSGSS
ncbi:MAG: hypothetical protein LC793_00880 [Thermomicrobia bacterium]|nr:hypothetical protein [Thermomicrobia bacterium]